MKKARKEIIKQCIDQPLHMLMSGGAVVWFALQPNLASFSVLIVGVFLIGFREGRQWPSSRWYDPYLDMLFFYLGAVLTYKLIPLAF